MVGRRNLIWKIPGALGFAVLVFGWFPLHEWRPLREWELWLAPRESRDLDLALPVGTRVVVNGRLAAGPGAGSEDLGRLSALDASGNEIDGVDGGGKHYSIGGAIARVTVRSGGAPAYVTVRVLREEMVASLDRGTWILMALAVVLLIPFLPCVTGLLSPWMARERSARHLRRRIGWIGVAIVGTPVLYHVLNAVISRIEHRYEAAHAMNALGFLGWSAWIWVGAVLVIAFASLERRAIGGQLLEMRASLRAVLAGALAVAVSWLLWEWIVRRVPHVRSGPYALESTADFPAAVLLALSAGVCEEVVFRGFLLTRLRELTRDTIGPLLATSVAFGLVHVYDSGWHGVHAGVLGLVLGIITLRSRNLYPAIWAHVANDLLYAVAVGFDAVRGLS